MTTNAATLRRWRPRTWNPHGETFETFDTTAESDQPPILVDMEEVLENRDLVTLSRAAERNGLASGCSTRTPHWRGFPGTTTSNGSST